MSMRSLIEFNHDYTHKLDDGRAFLDALDSYLKSGSRDRAEELERFGVRVLGIRHHSSSYIMDGTPDGFPPQYLERAKKASRVAP